MKIFDTLDELWLDAAKETIYGYETPSRDGPCTEMLGYVARLKDPRANFMFNPKRKMSAAYAAAELIWYLSGKADIGMIKAYAPQYARFAEHGKAFGAYGARIKDDPVFLAELFNASRDNKLKFEFDSFFDGPDYSAPVSQLQIAALLLSQKQETRQAVVTMWNGGDLVHAVLGDKKDIPCTLNVIFMVRKNKLYMSVNMRSNDVWLGLPYDVWCWTCIQQLLAEALDLKLGWYQHSAMSMHLYMRNRDKCIEATQCGFSTDSLVYTPHKDKISKSILLTVTLEEHNRKTKALNSECAKLGTGSLLHQCLVMMIQKWKPHYHKQITNKIMREYLCSS